MNPKQVHLIGLVKYQEGVRNAGIITEAELTDYFGVPCIKGRSLTSSPNHWAEGTTVYFPLDKIAAIVVYENEDAWRASVKSRPPVRRGWFRKRQ